MGFMRFGRACFGPGFMSTGSNLMMFLFWGILIITVIYIIKNLNMSSGIVYSNSRQERNSSRKRDDSELSSKEIAKRRYAKGEIDKEEFESILKNIKK